VGFFSQRCAVGCLGWLLLGCGGDAERRYAGLSRAEIEVEEGGFRARYRSPPWYGVPDDPLATGATEGVPVGGEIRPVVPESALVLEVERESSIDVPMSLGYPKYHLEAALLRCTPDQVGDAASCAEALAEQDFAGRADSEEEEPESFEPQPRTGKNDFGQQYWELMTRVSATYRHRRIQYYPTDDALVAVRVFVEANPALDDEETTRMLHAFEVLPGAPAGAAENLR
jgi:hypothetical protein